MTIDIVDGNASDGVDTLRLDRIDILHETRQMIHAAGRREGAGHREEHHFAAGEYGVGR